MLAHLLPAHFGEFGGDLFGGEAEGFGRTHGAAGEPIDDGEAAVLFQRTGEGAEVGFAGGDVVEGVDDEDEVDGFGDVRGVGLGDDAGDVFEAGFHGAVAGVVDHGFFDVDGEDAGDSGG